VPPVAHAHPIDVVWAAAGTPRAVFAIAPQALARVSGGRIARVSPD
jgi:hypothetical protein